MVALIGRKAKTAFDTNNSFDGGKVNHKETRNADTSDSPLCFETKSDFEIRKHSMGEMAPAMGGGGSTGLESRC